MMKLSKIVGRAAIRNGRMSTNMPNTMTNTVPTLSSLSSSHSLYHSTSRTNIKVGDSIPISYLKDESDPLILSRSEYPDWVWSLHKSTSPTLTSLLKKEEKLGDFNELEIEEQRRYLQLAQRRAIKEANLDRST
jgi:hypothetical protein